MLVAVQLCVAVDIQLVVLSCFVRHRKVQTSSISIWEREWPLFCLLPQCVVSSVPSVWKLLCCSLWLCYGRHIPRARRLGHNDHTPDSRPHHQCVVSKGVTPQGSADDMCCKEVVVDAYQCINISLWWICEVSVRVALEYFCPLNWNGGYCPPPKGKWTPMSGGGDRGDDGLGIRKCWVEVVFRYCLPHCVRCMPQSSLH